VYLITAFSLETGSLLIFHHFYNMTMNLSNPIKCPREFLTGASIQHGT